MLNKTPNEDAGQLQEEINKRLSTTRGNNSEIERHDEIVVQLAVDKLRNTKSNGVTSCMENFLKSGGVNLIKKNYTL